LLISRAARTTASQRARCGGSRFAAVQHQFLIFYTENVYD
jgi:hypothetical protein